MTERQRNGTLERVYEELSANRAYAEIAATLEGDAFALLIDLPDSPAFERRRNGLQHLDTSDGHDR